jgi:hypothetical protein
VNNNNIKSKKIHINDIVDDLVDTVGTILKYRSMVAMGIKLDAEETGYPNWDKKHQNELVDLVKPLIKNAQQSRIIEAECSKDVIKLLTKGKIATKEAMGLLALMDTKNRVEEGELKIQMQKDIMGMFSNEGD